VPFRRNGAFVLFLLLLRLLLLDVRCQAEGITDGIPVGIQHHPQELRRLTLEVGAAFDDELLLGFAFRDEVEGLDPSLRDRVRAFGLVVTEKLRKADEARTLIQHQHALIHRFH
jgi:hypothetical protein